MSLSAKRDNYIVNGAMSANITGEAIDCSRGDSVLFQATWDNTGSPTGTFAIQGRHASGKHAWLSIPIDRVMKTAAGLASFTAGDLVLTVNAAGGFAVIMTPVFDEMRLIYTAAGGTANTSLQVSVTVRRVS